MEKCPLFDGIREEWEARGELRGIEKGLMEGERRGRLDLLISLIEAKFGVVPDNLREQLMAIKEPDAIKEVLRKVVSSDSIDKIIATLK